VYYGVCDVNMAVKAQMEWSLCFDNFCSTFTVGATITRNIPTIPFVYGFLGGVVE